MSRLASTISTLSIGSTSTCCETCWPSRRLSDLEVGEHAHPAQAHGPDQNPRGHGHPQKFPVDLTALAAARENLSDDLGHRRELQQHVQRRATGRYGSGRKTLYVKGTYSHAGCRQRRGGNQHGVNRGPPPSRIVEPANQEYDAEGCNSDPLEDTQGTRLKAELVLRVVRIREKGDTGDE